MVKKHIKRLDAPKTWQLKRKEAKWTTKVAPGAHSSKFCLPINIILRDVLNYAKNNKEVKKILNNQEILVDGIRRKDYRYGVGLMDVLSIPKLNKNFRIILNEKGKLDVLEIKDSEKNIKPCRIKNKSLVKGKTQLNLFDGKNLIVGEGNYKTGDTIIIEFPGNKIKSHIKFEKGVFAYLIEGKHVGKEGIIENITNKKIIFKSEDGKQYETPKSYILVIGKEKPVIKLK